MAAFVEMLPLKGSEAALVSEVALISEAVFVYGNCFGSFRLSVVGRLSSFGGSTLVDPKVSDCRLHCVLLLGSAESQEVASAREYYQSSGGDASGTLSRWPKYRYMERQLLQGMEKHASLNNYLGALNFVRMGVMQSPHVFLNLCS